jgi:uncharacterized membrane-anchored protein
MRAFLQSYLGKGVSKGLLPAILVFALGQACRGDSLPLVPSELSLAPIAPSSHDLSWVMGPVKVKLGDYVSFQIPEGYRFVDAKGARQVLQSMRNPAPQDLVGLLAPNSGKWWVVLEFSDMGYVKDFDKGAELNAAAMLQAMRFEVEKQNSMRVQSGLTPVTVSDWVIRPVVDADHDTMEWALHAEAQPQGVINHALRLFGRRGFLAATAVHSDQDSADLIPLKELLKNAVFNPGERFADYQFGDPVCKIGLAQLVVGQDSKKTAGNYLVRAIIWGSVVLSTCGITGVVVVLRRIRRDHKSAPDFPTGRDPGLASLFKNGNGSNGSNGSRRRKTFNYQRYFSDMMLQVSSGQSGLELPVNGTHASHKPNGANGSNGWHSPQPEPGVNQALIRANLELIASQTNLIEEQKRLLQEQSKLIEEKSRLIREKNHLLEQQADLFERELL